MSNKIKFVILTLIIILAGTLRLWKLGSYPSFNADEAAIGYNAYSLLETGKDEHGNPWPIHFQSFNDYKPGLYFYIVLPFVKFFGLNEWSVRLPNAILGALCVYLIYLLVEKLYPNKEFGIIASFMLAISPWHIHFSRGGWEVNTATFFIMAGLLFFLQFRDNKKIFNLILSGMFFVISLYTYHAARIVVPLLGLGIFIIYFDTIKINLKKIIWVLVLCLFMLLPLANDFIKGDVASRAVGVGLFADPGPLSRVNEQRGEHDKYNGLIAKLYHNKPVNYGLAFLDNWVKHFHGEFLFLSGDVIERNRVPETGQMYILDFFWLIIGLCWFIRNLNKETKLLLWWLVIAPAAAALTFQSPHALRSQNMVIPLIIICAIGISQMLSWFLKTLKNKYTLYGICILITSVIVLQFVRYEHMYWVHMSKEYKYSSQYGVKELASFLVSIGSDKKVLVTDRYDQPYILFLFYLKYPPEKFQNNHVLLGRDRFGFSTVPAFDKYEFSSINFDRDKGKYPNYLLAGTDGEIPNEANIIKRIYGSNGQLYFEVVAN
ncbi:MAG: hypothetical protein US62_C0005G0008 [Candidatus Woesebacteria bacterium GW2011_GWA1_37_8]|uniref:ArnT-like N-terminal domain-containing protein n=1 Tax=Candidatus Woesebacteria bacterium GW2011_GWA1_37_8 TaxID=1618546 RepID=A0A0G0I561_9BACT|nr:MAG: hypothetical protein US39_C0004G0017 [Microgenomates group bacterium GW2011_GWC1_37_12b]KKQ46085.1 MAG: hypothetical protein US62_C0005G0008 [Candidatus Woesebacteria bacterium GW2011_GWA1_37_8]